MNLKRLVLPVVVTTLLTAVITAFVFYRKEKPFYLRLKRKRRTRYKLYNIRTESNSVLADLTNGKSNFTFMLNFLDNETIHLQINDPINTRYVVQDVILSKDRIVKDIRLKQEYNCIQIQHKNFKILINSEDFQINFYKNDDLFLTINSEKCFVIEEKEPHVGTCADFVFLNVVRAYGLPQHAERLSLVNNKLYRLFNTDRFAYSTSNPQESLYGAVPLIYAYGINKTTGLLWLNSSDTYIDIQFCKSGVKTTFFSESVAIDFYILNGPNLEDCVRQNCELTGVVPLPPLFALGYHQCRYSYMTQDEVIEVSKKFTENDFPLDCVWMDIDCTDDRKYFTWNPKTYPNPRGMLNFLENNHRKAVVIINPHVKVDDDYFMYSQCEKEGYFVKNPNGTTFTGKCWAGTSSWIDFFNPKARQYYTNLHKDFIKSKILHVWNDMNEPALFETKENSMDKNLLHYGNWKHRDVHNLYGFYQTMATFEGLLVTRPDLRPFILTRSHFGGSQRFAAIWTGDNVATWSHLKIGIPMCLTASLTGFSLCGADIGGFVKHPDEELLQRWYQLGAWIPFFRGHSNRNVPRREPYIYSKSVQRRIRNSLQQRYKHLFYWYGIFREHFECLKPVMRPLVYEYPHDQNVLDVDDQFLVGSNILVRPITEPGAKEVDVYLPGGEDEFWFQTEPPGKYKGVGYFPVSVTMDTILVFYRGGSIIPIVEHPIASTYLLKNCDFSLYIFCDKDLKARGSFYMDDGESFKYLENEYVYVKFNLENGKISNEQININHSYDQNLSSVYLYGYKRNVKHALIESGDKHNNVEIVNKKSFVKIPNVNINVHQKFIITLSIT